MLIVQDIFKYCTDEGVTMVTELPYFEGDFWPNVLEEFIKELDQEAREREASEFASSDVSYTVSSLHTLCALLSRSTYTVCTYYTCRLEMYD